MRPLILLILWLYLLASPVPLFAQAEFSAVSNDDLFAQPIEGVISNNEFLPVEQAYILNTEIEATGQLRLNWQIAEGYYLYRHGFSFKLNTGDQPIDLPAQIPQGLKKNDDYFGPVEVYYNHVDIGLEPLAKNSLLTVTSQGCADAGLCYPPRSEYFQLNSEGTALTRLDQLTASDQPSTATATPAATSNASLLYMLLLAILGGVILNLMPCVFPILSLKVLAFANDKNHSQVIHGTVYSCGVILSFIAVAAILVTLQAAGSAIGWGFHLQSPWFVALLFYLFFVMGLSLSGVIEFGGQWMNTGNTLAAKSGYSGSFFTGVLATVVASPCTAPFMGTALGFAVTQPILIALLVFAALGFGMALPVLILSCSPALLKKIPKPGPWMEQLKQFLAFPLYATAVWLCWVVGKQTGVNGMATLLLGSILLTLAIWLWQGKTIKRTLAAACIATALLLLGTPLLAPTAANSPANTLWQAYSPQTLTSLRQQGKPVFINITADWCITCLANEKITLSNERVTQAFSNSGITYLKGDWTQYDAQITELLRQYNRTGIPLYLVYPAGNSSPGIVLPQILTVDAVLEAIATATKTELAQTSEL